MMRRDEWLIALSVIVVFAMVLHSRVFPQITDNDSFYHIRHAWEYRTGGLWQRAFPWAQYSAMKTYAADIWYGYHLLLIPLTFMRPLLYGIYWGAFFTTVLSILLVYWAFDRLKVKWPIVWTMVFAMITADIMFRLSMLRPHPISLGLALVLFSWIHLAVSWILGLVTLAAVLPNLLQKRGLGWQSVLAVLGGIGLGWVARPNPLGAATLAYIQVVELMRTKQQNLPLGFGREIFPFYFENFVDQLIPITMLIGLSIGVLVVLIRCRRLYDRLQLAVGSRDILPQDRGIGDAGCAAGRGIQLLPPWHLCG
jgi:hypothetical protein